MSCRSPYLVGLFPEPTQPERTTGKGMSWADWPLKHPNLKQGLGLPWTRISRRPHAQGTGRVNPHCLPEEAATWQEKWKATVSSEKPRGNQAAGEGMGENSDLLLSLSLEDECQHWEVMLDLCKSLEQRLWCNWRWISEPQNTPRMRHTGPDCVWPWHSWD